MDGTFEYDDSNLQKLYEALDPKRREKALRRAFRREATRVRRSAVNRLRGSIRSDRDLESGIRAPVFKRKAVGFRVTVGTKVVKRRYKGKKKGVRQYGAAKSTWVGFGFHTNRQGLEKPVLIWAEDGTKPRRTKTATKIFARSRKGHNTGQMKRYGFMRLTAAQERGIGTANIHTEVNNSIIREAKKYGCK